MAETFNAFFGGVAFAATKNMAALINKHASELLKVRRITLFNSQTSAVTGVICQIELRKCAGFSLTGPTAVTPTKYDSNNTLPANYETSHAGTIAASTQETLRRIVWSSDEAAVSALTSDEVENFPPLNVLYEWQPHSDVQPIVLRQNEGIMVYNVSGAAGLLDVAIEFTRE
jgi:hypothetical protein